MQIDHSYFEDPQFIADDWSSINLLISELSPSKLFVLTDNNTFKKCLPILREKLEYSFSTIMIPQGESNKNLWTAEYIWQNLADQEADRQSVLINLGGGVVTDIGAFCADTFMRGIRCIQIPTSILAMTDAALGGKTGVDLGHLKNYIGSFSHPEAIFIYPYFIQTLPKEEQINGLGEIIKHAIIKGGQLWTLFQSKPSLDQIDWANLLKMSTQVKIDIVNKDPKEKGLRKLLNFGHTFGHAYESYSLQHDEQPMKQPVSLAIGKQGSIFITDSAAGKIYKLKKGDDEAIEFHTDEKVSQPTGISVDLDTGWIYIVDTISVCFTDGIQYLSAYFTDLL